MLPLDRLGLDVPRGWWPTAPMLKAFEAAGFAWVQVRTPPRPMLCQRDRLLRHAGALRAALDTCGLDLVLHAPDELCVGDPAHDRALDGVLDYAAATGARYVVYHAANLPVPRDEDAAEVREGAAFAHAADVRERAAREEDALRARVARLERLGVTLALENLAPVHPGPPRLCHDPSYVRALVDRLASPRVRMLFDAGHANIVAGLRGVSVRSLLDPVLDAVAIFHLHDNLGARAHGRCPPGLDPLRLDLHLPPGGGRLAWATLAQPLRARGVPIVLEVHPPHRPEPLSLHSRTVELLGGERATPARPAVASALAVPPG